MTNKYYYSDGSILHYRIHNKVLHRTDGPAVEWDNGGKLWYFNDKPHRIGGPAVEFTCGDKYWYVNGKRHRIDGPAAEWSNGYREWYINGKEYTKEEYNKQILIMQLSGLLDG